MSIYFVDTSALGRRYLIEVGWQWMRKWIPKVAGHVVIISDLASVEMSATFARLQRDGQLTGDQVAALQLKLLFDIGKEYLSISIDNTVLAAARSLTGKYPLRTLDAVQLACARQARTILGESIIFVAGDNRLLNAAQSEGFTTDNPYLHP